MITDEQTDLIIERLINRIEQANAYFLMKLGANIGKIRELTPTQAQQLVQILKYGGNYEDIIRELAKYTNLNIVDIDEIFREYAKKDQQFYKKFYKYRNMPFVEYTKNEALKRQTEALANIVKNEMYNYTRTNILGYTIKDFEGRTQFLGLRETYNRVLDEALLNVGQGKETFDSAMTNIMKEIGGSGLKTIQYESGRSMRLDSAARMHLKGRLRELHNENQKLIGAEFNYDGIEISVHSNPAPDHELAQGRQFSITEYDRLNNGLEARDYKGNIYTLDHDGKNGYRPISEMNCYHYIFSIILGVSKPEYTDEELQQIIDDNNKGFELDGKHYTLYEGEQLQRQLERKVREQKDIQILAKASGNDQLVGESQQKITQLTYKYKELSNISGLPTKMQRMKVTGYKRTKVNTKTKKNKLPYEDLTNELRNMKGTAVSTEKRLDYSLDMNMNKYDNYYFKPDIEIQEELEYQTKIELKTGYKVFLNPESKTQNVKAPDYWIEDIKQLWDIKGLDGKAKDIIDNTLHKAEKQTNNIILRQRKTPYSIEHLKSEIDEIFAKNKRPKIKQIVLLDKYDNIILYYKRK